MADLLAFAATVWGVLMAASPILQIRRMQATGSSADFSIGYMGVLLPGFMLWMGYGLAIGNAALIITNTASLGFGLVTIAIAVRLRRTSRPAGERVGPRTGEGASSAR